ncbi:GNAT family N-acetyltransferase [Amnibacterium endophyticum]|uniref:GNAT family N-acetyltransferase n=1 Tax=Amnibacterium endophyticum TaxID=2109337 RepID=A0ABW4LEQ1_9MICO
MRFNRAVRSFSDPVLLESGLVRLEPLARHHADGLAAAAADGDVWRKWSTSVPAPDEVPAEIERRLALQRAGTMAPWATCLPDGTPVGMTTYMNLDAPNRRLEIGSTWLAASAQRTAVNPAAKLLQLTRAFEVLDCIAVELRTDWHNRQSRRAIAALGAKQDGVLRSHMLRPGYVRDTVVFSIIASEWPAVRLGLRERLGLPREAGGAPR